MHRSGTSPPRGKGVERWNRSSPLRWPACDGPKFVWFGPHSRRCPLPQAHSAQELYEGVFTRIARAYPINYYWLWTPEDWEWHSVNASSRTFTEAVADLKAALAARDAANASFELATCGWVVGPLPDRTVFDKALPKGYAAIGSIDKNLGKDPVDAAYEAIAQHRKWVCTPAPPSTAPARPPTAVHSALQRHRRRLPQGARNEICRASRDRALTKGQPEDQ